MRAWDEQMLRARELVVGATGGLGQRGNAPEGCRALDIRVNHNASHIAAGSSDLGWRRADPDSTAGVRDRVFFAGSSAGTHGVNPPEMESSARGKTF